MALTSREVRVPRAHAVHADGEIVRPRSEHLARGPPQYLTSSTAVDGPASFTRGCSVTPSMTAMPPPRFHAQVMSRVRFFGFELVRRCLGVS